MLITIDSQELILSDYLIKYHKNGTSNFYFLLVVPQITFYKLPSFVFFRGIVQEWRKMFILCSKPTFLYTDQAHNFGFIEFFLFWFSSYTSERDGKAV